MEIVLFFCALFAFALCPPAAPLALRCGLSACLRFSPRASCALASVTAFAGCFSAFLLRGGPRIFASAPRISVLLGAFSGGVIGRMALVMFTSRFSGSLALLRVHAIPLLLLCICAIPLLLPAVHMPQLRACLSGAFVCLASVLEGFFGAGGFALLALPFRADARRIRSFLPAQAILACLFALFGALSLTHFSGAAQVFPPRMLLGLSAGAACGAFLFEHAKKRSALRLGMCAALAVYVILAALCGVEQAFRS